MNHFQFESKLGTLIIVNEVKSKGLITLHKCNHVTIVISREWLQFKSLKHFSYFLSKMASKTLYPKDIGLHMSG